MDRGHSKKRLKKSSKRSKRHRRSPDFDDEHDVRYDRQRSSKDTLSSNKLVEYSDVSSEDFSPAEAGEIKDDFAFNENNGNTSNRNTGASTAGSGGGGGSDMAKTSAPSAQRKIIVGSPISSSLSSHSRSKLSVSSHQRQHSASSYDDDDLKSDDSDLERKRKKSKKTKKKKNKKKRKKKRNRSISSIENISDNDSILDDEMDNLTPPLRSARWEKERATSLSKSPMTPPLRPGSNLSIYSDTATNLKGKRTQHSPQLIRIAYSSGLIV